MKSHSTEQQILFVILRNGAMLARCDLAVDDFTHQTDQMIYQAMREVAAEEKPVDLITVAEHLEQKHRTVDMRYLGELFEKGMGAEQNFESYVEIVKNASRKRKARSIAMHLQTQIEEGLQGATGDPVQAAIRDLMAIDQVSQNYEHTIKQAVTAAVELVQVAHDCQGLVGITSGINDLDDAIGGYHDTDLVVIPARPAMGKTAFLLSCLAKCGVPAGLISAEQDMAQIGLRLISMSGSVNSQNLRTANLSEDEWSRVSAGTLKAKDIPGVINDKPAASITDVVSMARKWKFDQDIKILYVDYIQKIKGSNPKATRVEQVTEVVGTLKNLAKELQIPVVALAQVNRQCEQRDDKRPKASDIADASEIEKESDVIMTLYRDEVYDEESPDKGIAEINIVKNRHGPIGLIRCQFIGKYFQFKDFEPVREMRSYA